MTSGVLAVIAAAVFVWGALSARLPRAGLTAPMAFVGVGILLAGWLPDGEPTAGGIQILTEVTLVWVLFSDAARVGIRELRTDAGVCGRLLGLALPLTVAVGSLTAWAVFDLGVWPALFVGAALAPTDAALGAVVITHPAVPVRIRRVLNVESGLNDGIITPVVLLALAGAASAEDESHGSPLAAVLQLAGGALVGILVGAAGGWLLRLAGRRKWAETSFAGPAVLALALLAYGGSVLAHGNGYVAAFAAGVAFGHVAGRGGPPEVFYVEQTAGLASLLVWTLFGATAVPLLLDGHLGLSVVVYAVLSLTVIRMAPVALALAGTGLGWRTTLFVGWLGPRGLASVIFALMALEELGAPAHPAVAVIFLTVLLSVVTHGSTASPLAARYGRRVKLAEGPGSGEPSPAARWGASPPADGESGASTAPAELGRQRRDGSAKD